MRTTDGGVRTTEGGRPVRQLLGEDGAKTKVGAGGTCCRHVKRTDLTGVAHSPWIEGDRWAAVSDEFWEEMML